MAVRHAGLRVLNTSNIFFPCPHKKDEIQLSPNPSFTATWAKWILNASDITGVFVTCCVGYRVIWLHNHWNDYTRAHLTEAVFDFAWGSAAFIGLCVSPIFRWSPDDYIWLLNQRCFQIEKACPAASMPSLVLEIFAAGFLFVPLAGFTGPFVLEVLPLQMLFGHIIETRFIASAMYGLTCLSQAAKLLTYFTLEVLFYHTIHGFNNRLLTISEALNGKRQAQFDVCHKMHSMGTLAGNAHEDIVIAFQRVLIFVGVLLGSTSLYAVIAMYNELHIVVYTGICFLAAICMLVALGFTKLMGRNYEQGGKFENIWKTKANQKYMQKVIKSWKHMGSRIQPYGIVKSAMGLNICDDIVQNTVTILCVQI